MEPTMFNVSMFPEDRPARRRDIQLDPEVLCTALCGDQNAQTQVVLNVAGAFRIGFSRVAWNRLRFVPVPMNLDDDIGLGQR